MIFTRDGERMAIDHGGNVCRWHEWPNGNGLWVIVRSILDAL